MSDSSQVASPHPWSTEGESARMLLRQHRDQLRQYSIIPTEAVIGAEIGRAEAPTAMRGVGGTLILEVIPADLQRMVQEYERDHPGIRLALRRLITIGDSGATQTSSEQADLPGEDEQVSFVATETVLDARRVRVRSRLLIAAIVPQPIS